MSVLIKGVTKTELLKALIQSTYFLPDDIEIIEVPTPHGRLIDAEKIKYNMLYKENFLKGTGVEKQGSWKDDIDSLATVIEAEE